MGDVTPFTGGKVPSKLATALVGDNQDLSAGVRGGYSVMSIKGSRWHIKAGDETTTITDAETGDAVGSLRLVLLKASPNISKNWYKDGYTEGSNEAPSCWSIDGITPDPAADKQAASCAACPKNQFGSRITDDGKKAKACSDSRRVAVIPEGDFKNEMYGGPMLLRVPASSLSGLSQFGKKMSSKGFPYNTIVTRCSFDLSVAYPKIEFNAVRPLNDEEADEIIQLLNDPEFADKIEAVLAKDLEIIPEGSSAEEEPLFEEAPASVQSEGKAEAQAEATPEPAPEPKAKPKAEAKPKEEPKVETKDESDDDLDADLEDILGSLDNLD